MRVSLLLLASIASAGAFAPHAPFATRSSVVSKPLSATGNNQNENVGEFFPFSAEEVNNNMNDAMTSTGKVATATAAMWAASASVASAAGPDWGLFEGRTGSLLHPITMAGLLGLSLYTGFLGLQWRRQRTMGDEISDLKKSMPDLAGASSIADAIAAAKAEGGDASLVPAYERALPIEQQINELTAERKTLASQGNRDKHFNQGAMLAFLGTAFAIEGPLNTYARAGKLFPGPHLYAGAGLVVLWAAAAACVPAMQKGNDTARSIHIAANTVGTGLFAWQVVSGIPILLKVIEKTQWP